MTRVNRRAYIVMFPLLLVTPGACNAPRQAEDTASVVPDSSALTVDPVLEETFDESPVPLLPGEGEPREFSLLLVNRLDADAYVFASAGAARVVLDTVPRSDSVFVDIRLRSDQVHLEAEDGSGRVISAADIDLVRAQVNRWEMTALRPDRTALRPKSKLLVSVADEDYPRSQ